MLIILFTRLYGSYESLAYGVQNEALQDFTGGLVEKIKLSNPPENLFEFLSKAVQRHSLLGASIAVSEPFTNPITSCIKLIYIDTVSRACSTFCEVGRKGLKGVPMTILFELFSTAEVWCLQSPPTQRLDNRARVFYDWYQKGKVDYGKET